jgi:hypothetical protein
VQLKWALRHGLKLLSLYQKGKFPFSGSLWECTGADGTPHFTPQEQQVLKTLLLFHQFDYRPDYEGGRAS